MSASMGLSLIVFAFDEGGHVVREQNARGYIVSRRYRGDLLVEETTAMRPATCDPASDANHCRLDPDALSVVALAPTSASITRTMAYEDPNWPDRPTLVQRSSVLQPDATTELRVVYDAATGIVLVDSTTGWTADPPRQETRTTITTLYDGTEPAVFAPGGETPVPAGSEGEICIAGPSLMKGYVPPSVIGDGPSIRNGWLRTGDLGWLDAEGYLTVSGRLKEIIIRGGENLSPGRIEEAILRDPSVRGCCVVGAPDADLGEVPVAYVVARDRASVRPATIQERVLAELPRSYVPARVIVLDALPEIGIGKVDRAALKRLAGNASPATTGQQGSN